MALANAGHSLDLKQRWSHSDKRMVLLEASVVDAIHAVIYLGKETGGRLTLHHITPSPDIMTTDLNVNGGLPCCDSSHNTSANDVLISAFLVLSSQNIPIDVLIDTGCLQRNVVSERIATLIRQDGVILTSIMA
jgi:hypothetical protein